jgi:flagellar motor component MotA
MKAVIGIVVSLGVFVLGILIARVDPLMFVDVPSIVIVLGFDLGALMVSGEVGPFLTGMKNIFVTRSDWSRNELLAAAETFGLMAKCSIGGGFIGTVMGAVMLLVNLNDPRAIGPYVALALITILYGLMLAFLLFLPGKVQLTNLANR